MLYPSLSFRNSTWTPASINTALWLDAADASTITESSGRISQWFDKSGNNRHATQSTAAQQPKVTASAQNGLDVVEFDPPTNSYQRLTFSRIASLGHIFFVAKKNDVNDSSSVLTDGSDQDLRGVTYGVSTGSDFAVQQLAPKLTTATRNVWHIAEIATDGINATLGIDASRVSAADADLMSTSDIGWYKNTFTSFVNQYSLRGQVAEFVISQSVLSSTDRQKLEGYLAHKWGLAGNLPVGHPYKNQAP